MGNRTRAAGTVTDIDSLFSQLPPNSQRYHELQRSRAAQEILVRRPLLEEIRAARRRKPQP